MKMFGFNQPQERVDPRFWTNTKNFDNTNVGRYVRNALLDGKTYPAGEQCPAWLKTRDAVHPFGGMADQTGGISSDYGGVKASASTSFAILQPWNTLSWWSPGGNGVGSWFQVQLPEPTLVESYAVGAKSSTAPLSWKLEGSLDGETWTDVHVLESTGVWDATYELKEITIPSETRGVYLYYRLTITASNAATMSLRNLRLFRPQSVCAKGQLLIDTSVLEPLVVSFADGFDVDGVTPIDHVKSIDAASLINMFDVDGYPAVRHSAITYPIPVNINAVLDPDTGSVSIETEDAGGAEIIQADGGMVSMSDKGWTCSIANSTCYGYFGKTTGTTQKISGAAPVYLSKSPSGVWCSKVYVELLYYSYGGASRALSLYAIEMDGSYSVIGGSASAGQTYRVGRRIRGLKFSMPSCDYPYFRGMKLYTLSSPMFRMCNGKLYQKSAAGVPWSVCHKVRIGSVVISPDGEVLQPFAESTLGSQVNWLLG